MLNYPGNSNKIKAAAVVILIMSFIAAASSIVPAFALKADPPVNLNQIREDFLLGNYNQSLSKLKKYLEKNPKDEEAYYLQFQIYSCQEKFKEAEAALKKAIDLKPDRIDYLMAQGNFYYKWGKTKKAAGVYNQLLEKGEGSPEIYRNLATIHRKKGDFKSAESLAKTATKKEPGNCNNFILLAHIQKDMGDRKQAVKNLEKAVRRGCKDKKELYFLADLYEQLGAQEKAIKTCRKILKEYPAELKPYQDLARIYRQRGNIKKSVIAWISYHYYGEVSSFIKAFIIGFVLFLIIFFFAFRYLNSLLLLPLILTAGGLRSVALLKKLSRYSTLYALDVMVFLCNLEIIFIDPGEAGAWNKLGWFYERREKFKKAQKYYQKAVRLDPKLTDAWFALGLSHYRQGKSKEAEIAFKEALHLDDENFIYWYHLAMTYFDQDMFDEAAQAARRSLQLSYDFALSLNLFAESCQLSGQVDMCLKVLYEMTSKHPRNVNFQMEMGNILLSTGRAEEAITYFEQAIELVPDSFEAWYNHGIAQREVGLLNNATVSIEKAIELADDFPWLYSSLGLTNFKNKKVAEAEKNLKRVLEIDPFSSYAHYLMGVILKNKNPIAARSHFNKSIEFFHEEAEKTNKPWQEANEYECLAIAYRNTGRKKETKKFLEEAVKYAKITPSQIWIFSEDHLKLVPRDVFIRENNSKIKELEPEVSVELKLDSKAP